MSSQQSRSAANICRQVRREMARGAQGRAFLIFTDAEVTRSALQEAYRKLNMDFLRVEELVERNQIRYRLTGWRAGQVGVRSEPLSGHLAGDSHSETPVSS